MRGKRIIRAIYFIWVFMNCYCLLDGIGARGGNVFDYTAYRYPDHEFDLIQNSSDRVEYTAFASNYFVKPFENNIDFDLTEVFVYIGIPAFLYFLVGYVRK